MSVDSLGVNILPKVYEAQLKKQQNLNFRANATNNLERAPQKDTVEKKGMSTGGKIALGAVALTGVAALIVAVAYKGKHIKNILGKTNNVTQKAVFQTDKPVNNSAQQVVSNPALKQEAERIAKWVEYLKKKLNVEPNPQLQRGHMFEEFNSTALRTMPESLVAKTESKHILAKTGEEVKIITDPVSKTRQVFLKDKMITKAGYDSKGCLSYVQNFDDLGREIEYFEGKKIITNVYNCDTNIISEYVDDLLDKIKLTKMNKNGSATVIKGELNGGRYFANLDVFVTPDGVNTSKSVKTMLRGNRPSIIKIEKRKTINGKYQTAERFEACFAGDGRIKVDKTKLNTDFTTKVKESFSG